MWDKTRPPAAIPQQPARRHNATPPAPDSAAPAGPPRPQHGPLRGAARQARPLPRLTGFAATGSGVGGGSGRGCGMGWVGMRWAGYVGGPGKRVGARAVRAGYVGVVAGAVGGGRWQHVSAGLGLGLELGRQILADLPPAARAVLPLPHCPVNALTWPAVSPPPAHAARSEPSLYPYTHAVSPPSTHAPSLSRSSHWPHASEPAPHSPLPLPNSRSPPPPSAPAPIP